MSHRDSLLPYSPPPRKTSLNCGRSLTQRQWLHTAAPTTNVSVAVNVFFRSLDSSIYSAGRDVYGNRDLAAYEKGRKEINRIANAFGKAPAACRQFYLLRLAEELAETARNQES